MPATPNSIEALEESLSEPDESVVELMGRAEGDIMFLGVGGKMGPTMARMAQRASVMAGVSRRVYGVSRFSDKEARARLESWGVETIACDLLDEDAVAKLPDCPNIIYLVGFKFGASAAPPMTWAINCQCPALVAKHFRNSRIVAFSTGNVYGFVSADSTGSQETDELNPVGEYSMAALGRERTFEYFATALNIPTALLRLNYATELRYGVLVDIALQLQQGQPVPVEIGYVNVLWLRDANLMTLRSLDHCRTPAQVINVAGSDLISVRSLAEQLADRLDVEPKFIGQERNVAFLNDGRNGHRLLGQPATPLATMIDWTADWIRQARPLLGKPTHFEVRDGKY